MQRSPGHILVNCHAPNGEPLEPVSARAAVVTPPLGVLAAAPHDVGSVRFIPDLRDKLPAHQDLGMGQALKVLLRFREAFWDRKRSPYPHLPRLAFLFAPDQTFPTWWTSYPLVAPLLTGWVAGPRAAPLAQQADAQIARQAVEVPARGLGVAASKLEAGLESRHLHNWNTDPSQQERRRRIACKRYVYRVQVRAAPQPRALGSRER